MVTKLFWTDPYLTEIETTVTEVHGSVIMLAETIFYAFSGGQESDSGEIAGYPVIKAEKSGHDILYTLSADHMLKRGDAVTVTIDWDRRYRLMRLHFAAELILELTYREVEGIEKIGAHISEDKARLDFLLDENISTYFPSLNKKALDLIDADLPIVSEFSDRETERRYWEIEGFARVSCGGTHLKRTGEVGSIELKRKNIGKGKERIEISLDS